MAASNLAPSPEKANSLRLLSLIIDGGTLVLRNLFENGYKRTHPTLKDFLSTKKKIVKKLVNDKVLRKHQKNLLYPQDGDPDCAQYDVTLLSALLQEFCGYNLPKKIPIPTDIAEPADIWRLRSFRNRVSHYSRLGIPDALFDTEWDEIEQVLLRLGNRIPGLPEHINKLKTQSIDPEMQQRYDSIMQSWTEMDSRITELEDKMEQLHEQMDALKVQTRADRKQPKISEKLQEIIENSQVYFHDYPPQDDLYVKTAQYKKALLLFQTTNILILTGLPGEGKTSMAREIIHEAGSINRCLRLREAREWTSVESKAVDFDIVFIDDIFGAGMLDEDLLKDWLKFMNDIFTACEKRSLRVIITTRHYILKDAKPRLKKMKVFKEEHVQELSSEELTDGERRNILRNHLSKGKVSMEQGFEEDSREFGYNYRQSHETLSRESDMFGFPECVRMYSNNPELRRKGAEFFRNPQQFAKSIIEDLYLNDKKKFLPFALIWAAGKKAVRITDLVPGETPTNLKKIASAFGFRLDETDVGAVKSVLRNHDRGFIEQYNDMFVFSHNVISDMVGVVLGQQEPVPVMKYASKEFLLRFITTEQQGEKEEVFIEKHDYRDLSLALKSYMFSYGNESIYHHTVFKNADFVETFITVCNEDAAYRLSLPNPICRQYHFHHHGLSWKEEFKNPHLSPAAIFLKSGNTEVFKEVILHEKKKKPACDLGLLLLTAIEADNIGGVDFILKHEAKVTIDALYIAVKRENTDILKRLLMASPRHILHRPVYGSIVGRTTPLIAAAKQGYLQGVELLIELGINVNELNEKSVSALDKAVANKETDVCFYLVRHGAELNKRSGRYGRTPFHVACDIGLSELIPTLLQHGADVYTRDNKGYMPIHSAILNKHIQIATILLEHDASQIKCKPIKYNKGSPIKGMNLLHIAAWKQLSELVDVLLNLGMDPDERDFQDRTSLHYAASGGNKDIVLALLRVANPNATDRKGQTPLHVAITKTKFKVEERIITSMNVNTPDKSGKTPLHLACEIRSLSTALKLITVHHADMSMVTKSSMTIFDILKKRRIELPDYMMKFLEAGCLQQKGQWCLEQMERTAMIRFPPM